MQVSSVNDVQIYNLSAGKTLPKWLSGIARRKLEKRNIDVRRRIELIQDFSMPDISTTINVTPDGRYIFATGAYKPVLKCYDLNDLSIKFERGLDADVIKTIILSDDYSKLILLQENRFIEMHAAFGRYFRMRMPRLGRDMAFSKECSDLYLVGASSEIYRLNLEQGEWLSPLQTDSSQLNCCTFADEHQLFVCGTVDGTVEAWDHRDKSRAGILDCVVPLLNDHSSAEITAVKFRDALTLSVGTNTGHVLLYDLRSQKPLLVKDHNYGLAIKKIDFVRREEGDIVLSMDSRVLKMWHPDNGRPFAAIEAEAPLTDFARYQNSGLIFFSNEQKRMLQHFVPALGPAPKWCSFLESLTEELEETETPTVYDDYKFVTRQQLDGLGLSHLIGSSVLRAYMHGYFIDARLYNKAQTLTQPFAYEKYKERKIKDILEEERNTAAVAKKETKLPKVNKEVVLRLQETAAKQSTKTKDKKKANIAATLLEDTRFKKMFESEDFQVDNESEQFKLSEAQKARNQKEYIPIEEDEEEESEAEQNIAEEEELAELPQEDDGNADEDMHSDLESSSGSEDEQNEAKKAKQKAKSEKIKLAKERRQQKYSERKEAEEEERIRRLATKPKKFVLHELATGETSTKFIDDATLGTDNKELPMAIKKRKIRKPGQLDHVEETELGGRSMKFTLEKTGKAAREERAKLKKEEHKKERREVVRRTTDHVARNMKRLPGNLNINSSNKRK